MKTIQCSELRKMIADILAPTIDELRATKEDQFFYEFEMPPTDDEIDEFIISSFCFDDEVKKFLLSEVGSVVIEDAGKEANEKIITFKLNNCYV